MDWSFFLLFKLWNLFPKVLCLDSEIIVISFKLSQPICRNSNFNQFMVIGKKMLLC
jgi:hypothetical protein